MNSILQTVSYDLFEILLFKFSIIFLFSQKYSKYGIFFMKNLRFLRVYTLFFMNFVMQTVSQYLIKIFVI